MDLRFAAGDLAQAAFELSDTCRRTQASITPVHVAAKLVDGEARAYAPDAGWSYWSFLRSPSRL